MKMDEQILELIDQYLSGALKGAALDNFKNQLSEDAELRNLLEEQKAIRMGIEESAHAALKKKLNTIHDELGLDGAHGDEETKVVRMKAKNNWTRYLAIAASVAILIVAGIYFTNQPSSNPIAGNDNDKQEEELLAAPRNLLGSRVFTITKVTVDDEAGIENVNQSGTMEAGFYRKEKGVTTYTFTDNQFKLFDTSGIDWKADSIRFIDIQGSYLNGLYLQIGDQYFKLIETEKEAALNVEKNLELQDIMKFI